MREEPDPGGRWARWLLLLSLLLPWSAARAELALDAAETTRFEFEWKPELEGFARTLMVDAEQAHQRVYAELGTTARGPITVVVLEDEPEMLEVARGRFGGKPPEWAAGLAYGAHRTIFVQVGAGPDEVRRTLVHEIVHLAVHDLDPEGRVPLWFNEGLAVGLSEPFAWERAVRLTEGAALDQLLDLDDIEQAFPRGVGRASLAYAQATHFVGYLKGRLGFSGFKRLLAKLAQGEDFRAAIGEEAGLSLAALETQWRQSLRLWWGWVPIMFGGTALWVLGGLLFLWGFRRRRRQRQLRIATLAAAEPTPAIRLKVSP